MGVLTDLFQATARELEASFHGWKVPASADEPSLVADEDAFTAPDFRHLPWMDMKGLSPGMLESLGAVLGAWSDDAAARQITGRALVGPPDVDDCVFAIPKGLQTSLCAVDAERVDAIAQEWSRRERARDAAFGITADEAATVLHEIVVFAREACDSGRELYMWMGD